MRGLAALALLIAGCAPAPEPAEDPVTPVSATDAVRLFDEICIASAPDFVSANRRMRDLGMTTPSASGAMVHGSGTASVKVQNRPSVGQVEVRRCSIVFQDNDSETALTTLQAIVDGRGLARKPRKRARIGSRDVMVWDLILDGREARMTMFLGSAATLPGSIYLEMPQLIGAA
ncbi:MAG: hypothetical protein AAF666_03445 [Pseudomonadota bacterium]